MFNSKLKTQNSKLTMPTILLVEDDPTLSETLHYNLERESAASRNCGGDADPFG